MEVIGILIGLTVGLGAFLLYMLPAVIAHQNKHHQEGAITMVNLFFGWTLIGWLGSLVWALSDPLSPSARDARLAAAFTAQQNKNQPRR